MASVHSNTVKMWINQVPRERACISIIRILSMYFYNIDRCKYFAERINRQPPTPKGSYVAVCEVKVVEKNTNIY